MNKKLPVYKKIGAIILTAIITPCLIISLFTFPVELIAFDPESYYPSLENETYQNAFPVIVSEMVTDQMLQSTTKELPQILSDSDSIKSIIKKYFPQEWINELFKNVIDRVTAYFNFKTPYTAIEVDIVDLKNALHANSSLIIEDYIGSLESCTSKQDLLFTDENLTNLAQLPLCKPSPKNKTGLNSSLSLLFENNVNRLPTSINIVGLIPSGLLFGDRFFYLYSVIRWIFRLLPFGTLLLLIMLAYILRENRKLMRHWNGLLLFLVPGITLLGLLIVLVGFDQFIGLIFNRYFSQVIAGFGDVLLGLMQDIGTQVILWVIAISGAIILFGLILLLSARFTKEGPASLPTKKQLKPIKKDEELNNKAISPDTLEEIEEMEKKTNKKSK